MTLTSLLLRSSAPSGFHHSPLSPSSPTVTGTGIPASGSASREPNPSYARLLLLSLAVPGHKLLLLRLRGRRNRGRETEGLEDPGMEGGTRPGS